MTELVHVLSPERSHMAITNYHQNKKHRAGADASVEALKLCHMRLILAYQWRIQETCRKGGFQTIERKARKIWGYAYFRCSKTRENPILSQGKSHLRLRGTAANSQLAGLG